MPIPTTAMGRARGDRSADLPFPGERRPRRDLAPLPHLQPQPRCGHSAKAPAARGHDPARAAVRFTQTQRTLLPPCARRQPRLRRRSLSWLRPHDRSPGGNRPTAAPQPLALGQRRSRDAEGEPVAGGEGHRPVRQPRQARGPRRHRGGVGLQRTGAGGGSGASARGSAMPDGALPIARPLCDLGVTLPIALGNAPKSRRPWSATAHGSSADLQDSPQATCNFSNGSCRMGGGGASPPGTHAPATECPGAAHGHRGAGWTHP
jgi:hypothetical protein